MNDLESLRPLAARLGFTKEYEAWRTVMNLPAADDLPRPQLDIPEEVLHRGMGIFWSTKQRGAEYIGIIPHSVREAKAVLEWLAANPTLQLPPLPTWKSQQ